jgi:hypothetical protein
MAGPFVRYLAFVKKRWNAGLDAFCLFGNDYERTPGVYERRPNQVLPGATFFADIRLWRALYLTPAFHVNVSGVVDMDNQMSLGLSWYF